MLQSEHAVYIIPATSRIKSDGGEESRSLATEAESEVTDQTVHFPFPFSSCFSDTSALFPLSELFFL